MEVDNSGLFAKILTSSSSAPYPHAGAVWDVARPSALVDDPALIEAAARAYDKGALPEFFGLLRQGLDVNAVTVRGAGFGAFSRFPLLDEALRSGKSDWTRAILRNGGRFDTERPQALFDAVKRGHHAALTALAEEIPSICLASFAFDGKKAPPTQLLTRAVRDPKLRRLAERLIPIVEALHASAPQEAIAALGMAHFYLRVALPRSRAASLAKDAWERMGAASPQASAEAQEAAGSSLSNADAGYSSSSDYSSSASSNDSSKPSEAQPQPQRQPRPELAKLGARAYRERDLDGFRRLVEQGMDVDAVKVRGSGLKALSISSVLDASLRDGKADWARFAAQRGGRFDPKRPDALIAAVEAGHFDAALALCQAVPTACLTPLPFEGKKGRHRFLLDHACSDEAGFWLAQRLAPVVEALVSDAPNDPAMKSLGQARFALRRCPVDAPVAVAVLGAWERARAARLHAVDEMGNPVSGPGSLGGAPAAPPGSPHPFSDGSTPASAPDASKPKKPSKPRKLSPDDEMEERFYKKLERVKAQAKVDAQRVADKAAEANRAAQAAQSAPKIPSFDRLLANQVAELQAEVERLRARQAGKSAGPGPDPARPIPSAPTSSRIASWRSPPSGAAAHGERPASRDAPRNRP